MLSQSIMTSNGSGHCAAQRVWGNCVAAPPLALASRNASIATHTIDYDVHSTT